MSISRVYIASLFLFRLDDSYKARLYRYMEAPVLLVSVQSKHTGTMSCVSKMSIGRVNIAYVFLFRLVSHALPHLLRATQVVQNH